MICRAVAFPGQFTGTIGGKRPWDLIFIHGWLLITQRGVGRGKDELVDPLLNGGLEEVQGAQDIYLKIKPWVPYGGDYAGMGSQVYNGIYSLHSLKACIQAPDVANIKVNYWWLRSGSRRALWVLAEVYGLEVEIMGCNNFLEMVQASYREIIEDTEGI